MENTNNNNPADMLEYINKVEAPPFLLTRIRQKIANVAEQPVAPKWVLAACTSLLLIVALNIYIISGSSENPHPNQPNLAQSMNLYPQNSLYE